MLTLVWAMAPVAILIKAPAGWLPGSIGAMHSDSVWRKDSRSIAPLLIHPRVSSLCLFFDKFCYSVIICKSTISVTNACLLWAQFVTVCWFCIAPITPLGPFPCFTQMISLNRCYGMSFQSPSLGWSMCSPRRNCRSTSCGRYVNEWQKKSPYRE